MCYNSDQRLAQSFEVVVQIFFVGILACYVIACQSVCKFVTQNLFKIACIVMTWQKTTTELLYVSASCPADPVTPRAASRPQFVFSRVRTPYTTPRSLPRIGDHLSATHDPTLLLPFRKVGIAEVAKFAYGK